jgi:hypothetical protein
MAITYPPELLPRASEDDDVEIIICERLSRSPILDESRLWSLGCFHILALPSQEARGLMLERGLSEVDDT